MHSVEIMTYYEDVGAWWDSLEVKQRRTVLFGLNTNTPASASTLKWDDLAERVMAAIATRLAATRAVFADNPPPLAPKEIRDAFENDNKKPSFRQLH